MAILIKPAANNLDKQFNYRQNMGRYNRAMHEGFYFEALLISYAFIEDRLRSFLYHIAAINGRTDLVVWKKTKQQLRSIGEAVRPKEKPISLSVKSLSGKMAIVRDVFQWVNICEGEPEDAYMAVLKTQCLGEADAEAVLATLDGIEAWKKYRNEVIHGLMNKNYGALCEDLAEKCEEGMALARMLDEQLKLVKKGNRIRRKMKIPTK